MQKDAERVVPCSRVFMAVSSFKRHGPNLKARRLEIQLMGLVAHAAHAAHLRQKPPEAGCKPSLSVTSFLPVLVTR